MIVKNPALLKEFRHAPSCEICGRENRTGLDPHHRRKRGLGGGSRLDIRINLIAVCRSCHNDCESGKVREELVLSIIAVREKTTVDAIMDEVDRILRTPK